MLESAEILRTPIHPPSRRHPKILSNMDEDQTKWNARAKNTLFDAISEEIFDQVHSKKTTHEVWEELETIHVGSKKLRDEKYQVLKENSMSLKCFLVN